MNGLKTVISINIKRIISFTLILFIVTLVVGCSETGKLAARDIVEEHATDRYEGATKAVAETTVAAATQAGGFGPNFKFTVDINGADIVDTRKQIQYGGFTFQIEDLKLGNTIYDVNTIMTQEEADTYCQYLLNRTTDSTVKSDGTFGDKDTQMVFMKCKIKNNSAYSVNCKMAPNVCGLQNSKTWGTSNICIYGFSGRHELYTDPRIGIPERTTYTYAPGEELETVFILGFYQYGNPSKLILGYQDEGADIYLSTEFLSNRSPGGKLATGSFLFPIFKGGKLVN